MGADLLLSGLVHGKNKKLDWAKGRTVAKKLTLAEVETGLEECYGGPGDNARESRAMVNDIINDLKAELALAGSSEEPRDCYTWHVGGKVLHIRGGTSDGDDPSHGFTVFTNAYCFPKVLKAIGFDVTVPK